MDYKRTDLIISLTIALIALLSSCGDRRAEATLAEAGSLMNEHPDSALALIHSLDTTSFHSRKMKARRSLLLTTSLFKSGCDSISPNVLFPASEYYSKHGYPDDKMRTLFYQGEFKCNAGEYDDALLYFLESEKLADESEDNYFKGLLYMEMGDSYIKTYNVSDCLLCNEKSRHFFSESGNAAAIDFSSYSLAMSYSSSKMWNKADSLFSSIINSPSAGIGLRRDVALDWARSLLIRSVPEAKKACSLFEKVVADSVEMTLAQYYDYAYSLVLCGDSRADALLNNLQSNIPDIQSKICLSQIAKEKGNYKLYADLSDEVHDYQDSIVWETLRQSVYKSRSNFFRVKANSAEKMNRVASSRLVYITVISLLIILNALFIFLRYRSKTKAKMDTLISVSETANDLLCNAKINNIELENKMTSLRSYIVSLSRSKFTELSRILDKGNDASNPESFAEKVGRKKVNETMKIVRDITERNQGSFEARIDEDMFGVMTKFRIDFPDVSCEDRRLFSYVVAGFDSVTISALLDVSKDSVRTKKHRIKVRIDSFSGPDKGLYETFL